MIQGCRSRSQTCQETNPHPFKKARSQWHWGPLPKRNRCPKASVWQSWEELGSWTCVTTGAEWILNTSLHGYYFFLTVTQRLSLLSSLVSLPLVFNRFSNMHAGGKRRQVSIAANWLEMEQIITMDKDGSEIKSEKQWHFIWAKRAFWYKFAILWCWKVSLDKVVVCIILLTVRTNMENP